MFRVQKSFHSVHCPTPCPHAAEDHTHRELGIMPAELNLGYEPKASARDRHTKSNEWFRSNYIADS